MLPPLMPLLPPGLTAVYLAAKRQEVKLYDARMQVLDNSCCLLHLQQAVLSVP